MIRLSHQAEKIFDLLVGLAHKKTKYSFTMPVDYEGSKLLIRPFIFSEVVMVSGLWENYVKSILYNEVKKSDVIAEVGANIGIYAIPLARTANKVIAFEPHPQSAEMLEKSIEINGLDNVVLVKKAISDLKSKLLFCLTVRPMNSAVTTSEKVERTIEVESVDLDTSLATETKLDWLLIDVEGYEVKVLNGAQNILKSRSPKIIIEANDSNKYEINEILSGDGYSVTHVYGMYYYAVKNSRKKD